MPSDSSSSATARTERQVTTLRVVGLLVGFAGAWSDRPLERTQPRAIGGALACLGVAASYGLSYVYMGRQLAGLSPLILSAAQLTAATGLLLLVTPVAGLQPVQLTRRSWRQSASLARWAPARPMS